VVGDGLGLQHLSLSEQKNPAVRQDFSHSQQYLRASGLVQRLNHQLSRPNVAHTIAIFTRDNLVDLIVMHRLLTH